MKKLFALGTLLLAASAHAQGIGPSLWGRGGSGSTGLTAAGAVAATGWTSNGTTTTTTQIVSLSGGTGSAWTFERSGDNLLVKNGATTTLTWPSSTARPDFPFGVDSSGVTGFRSSSTSGSPAFSVLASGARIDHGAGANDYSSSDGTTVAYAGPISAVGITTSNGLVLSGSGINVNNAGGYLGFNATTQGSLIFSGITAASAGATPATSALRFYTDNALDATDYTFHIGTAANAATLMAVDYSGNALITGAKTKGSKVLAAGTGTVTVLSGAKCVCSNETSGLAVTCPVSGTTLTVTSGVGTDTVSYVCL